ncbi:MAG: PIN domain-containing protein [Bacteroidota bacterium]
MNSILSRINQLEIAYEQIIESYGDVDAFSQKNDKFPSRNMGKNDIWIAATAKAFDIKLITTDKDFDHLKDGMIDLLYIDLQEMKYGK